MGYHGNNKVLYIGEEIGEGVSIGESNERGSVSGKVFFQFFFITRADI